jgi:hypothetical protein
MSSPKKFSGVDKDASFTLASFAPGKGIMPRACPVSRTARPARELSTIVVGLFFLALGLNFWFA